MIWLKIFACLRELCTHVYVSVFELTCAGAADLCKMDACHRQFPIRLSLHTYGPFNRLDFGVTLICPVAILSTDTHSVLLLTYLYVLYSSLLLSLTFFLLFFLTPLSPLQLLHVSSCAALSRPVHVWTRVYLLHKARKRPLLIC